MKLSRPWDFLFGKNLTTDTLMLLYFISYGLLFSLMMSSVCLYLTVSNAFCF